jgi:hypothetical protein
VGWEGGVKKEPVSEKAKEARFEAMRPLQTGPKPDTLTPAVEALKVADVMAPKLRLPKAGAVGKGHPIEIDLEAVMAHVENGGTIAEVAKEIDAKHWMRTQGRVMRMIAATPESQRRYEVATVNRAMLWADEVVALTNADCTAEVFDARGNRKGVRTDNAKVNQLRLKIDTMKWAVEHLLPRYNDKEQKEKLGDALSTLVRGLSEGGKPGQTALPMVQRVDDVED